MRLNVMALLAALLCCVAGITYSGEKIALPAPRTGGGMSLLEAINTRSSGSVFTGAVDDVELATVLWAATGRNRDDGGWTVPMAMGKPPYAKVYVAGKNGAFLYDWAGHALEKVSDADLRAKIGMQGFVKNAYYNLVMVVDGKAAKEVNKKNWVELGGYAVGAMTEHIYLVAKALGLETRFVMSVNVQEVSQGLGLDAEDVPACIMVLGRP